MGREDRGVRGGGLVGLSTKTAHTNQPEIMALVVDCGPGDGRERSKEELFRPVQGFIELWPAI